MTHARDHVYICLYCICLPPVYAKYEGASPLSQRDTSDSCVRPLLPLTMQNPRRRAPDMAELPAWLSDPLSRLVRARPRMEHSLLKGRIRPTADWDGWACRHLTLEYWGAPGRLQAHRFPEHNSTTVPVARACTAPPLGWFDCVRLWSAANPQGKLQLVPDLDQLIRAIVRLVVSETILHQHNETTARVSVKRRRHINTTAMRQGVPHPDKLCLYHVVELVLTRFDFHVARNRVSITAPGLDEHVRAAFNALHVAAAAPTRDSTRLREHVLWLTDRLRAFVRRALFAPWHVVVPLPAAASSVPAVEFAARTFVAGLHPPDLAFLVESPPDPHSPSMAQVLAQLRHPHNAHRWTAFAKVCNALRSRIDLGKEPHYHLAFVIIFIFLYAAAYAADPLQASRLCDHIRTVAEAQARQPSSSQHPLVFRDLLDNYLCEPGAHIPLHMQHRFNNSLQPICQVPAFKVLPPEIIDLARPPINHTPVAYNASTTPLTEDDHSDVDCNDMI